MNQKVMLNNRTINTKNFNQQTVVKDGRQLLMISFEFEVTSSDYHAVTALLYENDFTVKVPDENLDFSATIQNYSTSITNLYEENNVGIFNLELIQKAG
ncbi:DUF3219 family protein [Virgibacillus ainsalahensis]